MNTPRIRALLALMAFVLALAPRLWSAPSEVVAPQAVDGSDASVRSSSEKLRDWLSGDYLTGDWGGGRTWLKEHGITIKPRLTQFVQGMTSGKRTAGSDESGFQYGDKADVLVNADLSKLGFWKGLSATVHAEYNFGENVNGNGGTLSIPNTALFFPGDRQDELFDLSSVYLQQQFGKSTSLVLGKVNMIDPSGPKPFSGGAGIDSFWNINFATPPSSIVPPYCLGAFLTVRTKPATFGLWIFDPTDIVNKSGFTNPGTFHDGISYRGSVDFNVKPFGRSGRQGFAGVYSNQSGINIGSKDTLLPRWSSSDDGLTLKNNRWYWSYSFDQYLYQSKENPKEGFGLFGHFGMSDGNPNRLRSLWLVGLGGRGLIPTRSRDNYGVGFYNMTPSSELKDTWNRVFKIRNEYGWEMFYNVSLTPWLDLGFDMQIIKPSFESKTASFTGMRTVVRF